MAIPRRSSDDAPLCASWFVSIAWQIVPETGSPCSSRPRSHLAYPPVVERDVATEQSIRRCHSLATRFHNNDWIHRMPMLALIAIALVLQSVAAAAPADWRGADVAAGAAGSHD